MKFPASAAGRLAEFVKSNREDTNSDVLVTSGFKRIKQGDNKGHMVALYRPSNSENLFANLKNAILGRRPAKEEDVLRLLKNAGMSEAQASTALENITLGKGGVGYSALSVKDQIAQFKKLEFKDTIGIVTIHSEVTPIDDTATTRF